MIVVVVEAEDNPASIRGNGKAPGDIRVGRGDEEPETLRE
jgi:hypothetical protein